jgi:hypothetical protein
MFPDCDDADFQHWKLRFRGELDKVIQLERAKRQIALNIFFIDLHQQATFRQYQKIIAKIGAFNPAAQVKPVRPRPISLPDFLIPDLADPKSRLIAARARLDEAVAALGKKKEALVLAATTAELLATMDDIIAQPRPPAQENADPRDAIEMRTREVERKAKLDKLAMRQMSEIQLLKKLERGLREKVAMLNGAAVRLVRERKWRPGGHFGAARPKRTAFRDQSR